MPLFSRPPKPNWLTHPSRQSDAQQQAVVQDTHRHTTTTYANGVYYPSWRIYRQQTPSSMKLASVSHAFYAFARVRPDGTVYLHDEYADTQIEVDGAKGCLNALVLQKGEHPHLKVILSIGGGGEGSIPFPAVASNQATRQVFATTSRALVDAYNLDGIDIDWEHPSDPRQGANYIQLLADIRTSLPSPQYLLTTALPAGEWALRNIDLSQAAGFLDYINVMAYDFSGPWTPTTGHQSQLYTPKSPHSDAAVISCHSAVQYMISKGVPPRKLLLGIPAYGRSFVGAKKIGEEFASHGGEEGVFEYRDLPRQGAKEHVDAQVGAAYCIGGDGGFVTYDNPETVHQKATFAKQRGLGGLFYWTGTADYDPIDHLNAIFSHPSTLHSVPRVSKALRIYQDELDSEISAFVLQQSSSDADSIKRIQSAKDDLAELFKKVEGVRERAIQTEQTITEMTADIKRLDNTKRNLTLSMTALKRLQMLTTAYEQLRGLSSTRQYRECAQLLQAVIQLMAHFKSYRSIDQIATLSRNVADLQRELLEQICEDFEVTFAKGEIAQRRGMLAEACSIMDALGENARSRLITWYCNTQLREYRQVFRGNEEAGSLDNISRRYSWFRRMLKTYDEEHAALFPPYWRVNEMLANAFCEGTREDFRGILSRAARKADGMSLDVNMLLSCLQETLDFEQSLEKRFSNTSRASMDTLASSDDKSPIFSQAISEAFEPYLSIWVEAQDKQLSMMIPKYHQQPPRPPDEEFSSQMVIPSSTELFSFYRLTLAQCSKLSNGDKLVELTKVFAKYLDQYAQQVLLFYVSERPTGQTPSKIPQLEDMILVLNTADYCFNTCTQLEEKIRSRIDENLKSSVDLQSQADAFMGIASATVRSLVRRVEVELESTWREMRNTGWSKMESVGDQSSYVAELVRRVESKAREILGVLHKQQYARAFCDNVVELVANTYLANIFQCKPVSEVGAEQMLLDTYVLQKSFSNLITLSLPPNTPPPTAYIKRVQQSMSRLSPLLKTLQVRASPPEALVQAYLIHIADKSDANFRKVLELKGIPKKDHSHLLELFQAHRSTPSNEKLPQNSPMLTPLNVSTGSTSSSAVAGALSIPGSLSTAASLSTSNLQGRFDPLSYGSAMLTAARDGVDRLGTPALGGSSNATPSGTISPFPGQPNVGKEDGAGPNPATGTAPTGNLNENLRNIGKFFKRDMSNFGRFGGGAKGEDS